MVVQAHIGDMIAENSDSEIQGQISSCCCLLTLTVNKYVPLWQNVKTAYLYA